MPWYRGPAAARISRDRRRATQQPSAMPLRLPVQYVNRPNANFRGYAGTVASGALRKAWRSSCPRTGVRSRIARIVTMDGELDGASAADAVTVVLADDIDVSRGDIISSPEKPPQRADAFAAHLVWMSEAPLLPGRTYLLKCRRQTVERHGDRAQISHRHRDFRSSRRQGTASQRDRLRQYRDRRADQLRPLRRQSRYRRIYSDRPPQQRDGGRRHDPLRPAPRRQYLLSSPSK